MTSHDGDSSARDRKRRRRKTEDRHTSKRSKSTRRSRSQSLSSSSSSSSSSSIAERRHKRHKRKKRSSRNSSRKRDKEYSTNSTAIEFAVALHNVLENFADMGEQLLSMLLRMSSGSSFDLNQVNPLHLRNLLTNLFTTLSRYGVEQDASAAWQWKPAQTASRAQRQRLEKALIELVAGLLDTAGITLQAIDTYEQEQITQQQQQQVQSSALHNVLQILKAMIHKFSVSLSGELVGLLETVLDGQMVILDGLDNQILKQNLESLFEAMGLIKITESQHDEEGNSIKVMGYVIPDRDQLKVKALIENIQKECHTLSIRRIGPSRPQDSTTQMVSAFDLDKHESSSDESEGPAPIGSVKGMRRVTKEEARLKAKQRQLEMDVATGKSIKPAYNDDDDDQRDREEWMLTPGQHTFLDAVDSTKGRNFKNEKRPNAAPAPISESVKREMEELQSKAIQVSNEPPSLMDVHRAKKALAQKEASQKFDWKRDDLDKGRRVDKNALGMIMGGAADNLGTKFSRGFN